MKNIKTEQELRDETAKYLKAWRMLYNTERVSAFFGHGKTKTIRILRRSKKYLSSKMRKAKGHKWMKIKNHPKRKLLAKYLNEWRKGLNGLAISEKYKDPTKTVLNLLYLSKRYLKSVRHLSQQEQMGKRWSPFRKELAVYLREWKKEKNIVSLAGRFGIGVAKLQSNLWQSKYYRRYYEFKQGLTKKETIFILRTAKKIVLVNMLGGKCSKCGESDIFVLDFHHAYKNKEDGIATMLQSDMKLAKKEAKKCVLMCRNCHMKEHSNISLYEKLKEIIKYRSVRM